MNTSSSFRSSIDLQRLLQSMKGQNRDYWSYLFLAIFALNSTLLMLVNSVWILCGLSLLQAFLFIGLQELKHQAVHSNFISIRWLNDLIGMFSAALTGQNFIGYRYFHLRHHQYFCTDQDPEGDLYRLAWSSRWVCVCGFVEQIWVAYHTNRNAKHFVPLPKFRLWLFSQCLVYINILIWILCSFFAFKTVFWLFLLPFCLYAWIDFWFTQAEHYQTPIVSNQLKHEPSDATMDILLPRFISFLMLHRSLHRTHHTWPAIHWSNLPKLQVFLPQSSMQSMYFIDFVKRWFVAGPRLWLS